jgi:hypothetical protein
MAGLMIIPLMLTLLALLPFPVIGVGEPGITGPYEHVISLAEETNAALDASKRITNPTLKIGTGIYIDGSYPTDGVIRPYVKRAVTSFGRVDPVDGDHWRFNMHVIFEDPLLYPHGLEQRKGNRPSFASFEVTEPPRIVLLATDIALELTDTRAGGTVADGVISRVYLLLIVADRRHLDPSHTPAESSVPIYVLRLHPFYGAFIESRFEK